MSRTMTSKRHNGWSSSHAVGHAAGSRRCQRLQPPVAARKISSFPPGGGSRPMQTRIRAPGRSGRRSRGSRTRVERVVPWSCRQLDAELTGWRFMPPLSSQLKLKRAPPGPRTRGGGSCPPQRRARRQYQARVPAAARKINRRGRKGRRSSRCTPNWQARGPRGRRKAHDVGGVSGVRS